MDAQIHDDLETGDDNANAFLSLWSQNDASLKPSEDGDEENKKKPAPPEKTEEPAEDAEEPSEESTEEDEGETEETTEENEGKTEEQPSKAKKVAEDDAIVRIKVGEEEQEFKVADLKRLAGQEKALTQKGMEVAATRKQLEEQGARHVAAHEALLAKATERLKPYENVDWVQAAVKLAPEEYQSLRAGAQEAWNDVQFHKQGLDGYLAQVQQHRNDELVNEARHALKELADPEKGIKGFNKDVYNEMRTFAMRQGVSEQMVNQIVSAPALKIIHAAMLYEKGQKANTTKIVKTAKKIVKSANTSTPMKDSSKKAFDRLKDTGHIDDAEAAFLERFTSKGD